MANELSLDNVGGIFVVLLAGMGIACSIAVFEYIWKSRRLEKKINIRHSDLVKKAIVQTNTNMFYINRNSLDINGRGTIHTDHSHNQVDILFKQKICCIELYILQKQTSKLCIFLRHYISQC